MASQPQYPMPPQFFVPPQGGKNNSSTTIILVVVFLMLLVSMGASIYFLFFRKVKGKKCTLKDKDDQDDKGTYKYDEDLECVLDSCEKGYVVSGTSCVKEKKAGDSCVGTDSKGTYKLDANKNCKLQSCSTGYKVENGKCVSTTPSTTSTVTTPATGPVVDGGKYWIRASDVTNNDVIVPDFGVGNKVNFAASAPTNSWLMVEMSDGQYRMYMPQSSGNYAMKYNGDGLVAYAHTSADDSSYNVEIIEQNTAGRYVFKQVSSGAYWIYEKNGMMRVTMDRSDALGWEKGIVFIKDTTSTYTIGGSDEYMVEGYSLN